MGARVSPARGPAVELIQHLLPPAALKFIAEHVLESEGYVPSAGHREPARALVLKTAAAALYSRPTTECPTTECDDRAFEGRQRPNLLSSVGAHDSRSLASNSRLGRYRSDCG